MRLKKVGRCAPSNLTAGTKKPTFKTLFEECKGQCTGDLAWFQLSYADESVISRHQQDQVTLMYLQVFAETTDTIRKDHVCMLILVSVEQLCDTLLAGSLGGMRLQHGCHVGKVVLDAGLYAPTASLPWPRRQSLNL